MQILILIFQAVFAIPFLAIVGVICVEVVRAVRQRRANRAETADLIASINRNCASIFGNAETGMAALLPAVQKTQRGGFGPSQKFVIGGTNPDGPVSSAFVSSNRGGYDSIRRDGGHAFSHGREYGFGRSIIAEFPADGGGLRPVAHSPDVPECP